MTNPTKNILLNLFKHDLAACEVYKEVLEHIKDTTISQQISKFLSDHERHVTALSRAIENLTGSPPEREKDLKGTLLSGYTSVRSLTGQEGALNALDTAEKIVLKVYKDAQKHTFDATITQLIKDNLADEERHSKYIKDVLSKM